MYRNKILGSEQLEVFKYLKSKFMGDAVIAGGAVRDMFFKKPFKDIDIWFHSQKIGVPQRFFELYLPRDLQFNPKEDYIDISDRFPGEQITEAPPPAPRTTDDMLVDLSEEALLAMSQPLEAPRARRFTFGDIARARDRAMATPISSGEHLMDPSRSKRVNYSINLFYKGDHYQLMNVSSHPMNFVRDEFDIGLCKIAHDGERIIRTKAFDQDLRNKTLSVDGKKLGPKNFEWSLEKHVPRIQKLYPDFKVNVISKPTKNEIRGAKADKTVEGAIRAGTWAQWTNTFNTAVIDDATTTTAAPVDTRQPTPFDLTDRMSIDEARRDGTPIFRWDRVDHPEVILLPGTTTPRLSGLVGTWQNVGRVDSDT